MIRTTAPLVKSIGTTLIGKALKNKIITSGMTEASFLSIIFRYTTHFS